MDNKFKIRTLAMCIAKEIYCNLSHNLLFEELDLSLVLQSSLPDVSVSAKDVSNAIEYLKQKNYIQFTIIGTKIISGKITALGIDWVEDNL